ncbi:MULTISPECIES: aspartyl protease family protein [unclassified Brevundimonas]|uniref:aspartyl protease family protein n=1 Tax=unclassified Brevundimonas TaxID=2622653 RepID=UPI00142FC5CF|nr:MULTISPECIES: aspartyl protease family protein [unclassified Brevundimonas]
MLSRRSLLWTAAGWAVGAPAAVAQEAAPGDTPHEPASARTRGRVVAATHVNGRGPLRFAIDSAANCSVIASDLVAPLELRAGEPLTMHTLLGAEVVPSVWAEEIASGARRLQRQRLAVGLRSAMEGLDGLLGMDFLLRQRLTLNFRGGVRARIGGSSARRGLSETSPSLLKRTNLLQVGPFDLFAIPVKLGRAAAVAIVDSGAEASVINLPAAIAGRARTIPPAEGGQSRIQSPSGLSAAAHVRVLPRLSFAGYTISQLPVVVGDFHTFRISGLEQQPAMLLAVDVLSLFDSVWMDLGRGEFGASL